MPTRSLLALFAGSFTLVCSEFLPPGLLTAIAGELGTTPGVVGLSVSATALTALVSATSLGLLLPRLDRRTLLVSLAVFAALSDALVALAPNAAVLIAARLLLGVAVGGFWALALVVVSQLVPADRIARGMSIVNAGTMVATVAGVPLGVVLSALAGWRATFAVAALLCLVAAVALWRTLPPVRPAAGIAGANCSAPSACPASASACSASWARSAPTSPATPISARPSPVPTGPTNPSPLWRSPSSASAPWPAMC